MAVDHLLGLPHHPIIQDEVLHYKLHLPFIPHHLQVHLPIIAIGNLFCYIWQRLGTFECLSVTSKDGPSVRETQDLSYTCLFTRMQ